MAQALLDYPTSLAAKPLPTPPSKDANVLNQYEIRHHSCGITAFLEIGRFLTDMVRLLQGIVIEHSIMNSPTS